jgi:hypothetical protein
LNADIAVNAGVRLAFGVWRLAFGVWRLAFGVWRLAFGVYQRRALAGKFFIRSKAS